MIDKQQVLTGALNALNKPENPWLVTVDGDKIVAMWKWMDATFFGVGEVTREIRDFKFIVTLLDNGKWKEKDIMTQSSANVDLPKKDISLRKDFFSGHAANKTITIGLGKDHNTGQTGLIKNKFDTAQIKEPVREYLKDCGWKKKGLF